MSSKQCAKRSVRSVSSVREKDILRERKRSHHEKKEILSVRDKARNASCKQSNRGISVITPLPAGEGLGGGATSS